jgi:hypothetical protein
MSTPETTPANRNRLLIIIGAAVVVLLLAVIAISVSSQAIRAGQEAEAKASAEASASASMKAAADAQQAIEDESAQTLQEAETACHEQVLKQHPTAEFKSTRSRLTGAGSYETVGEYTDEALYDNMISMQFVCSSTNENGTSWDATLTALGRQ